MILRDLLVIFLDLHSEFMPKCTLYQENVRFMEINVTIKTKSTRYVPVLLIN